MAACAQKIHNKRQNGCLSAVIFTLHYINNLDKPFLFLVTLILSSSLGIQISAARFHLLVRDVDPRPTDGRDAAARSLPGPGTISRRHDGAQPRALTGLGPQHDGAQPRAAWLWPPPSPTGTLRISSGQHAPDAQSINDFFFFFF